MPGTPNIEFSAEFIWELLEEETVWLSDDFEMKLKLHKSWYIAFSITFHKYYFKSIMIQIIDKDNKEQFM